MSEETKQAQEGQDTQDVQATQEVQATQDDQGTQQPKKKSLAEAAKEMLAQKKKGQGGPANHQKSGSSGGPVMRSQHTNKPTNTRRKMGSS
ncbi:MAG: hypothetical protein K0R67_3257 [Paenibacillus sp.]|nr:hypothetical protein [Paenibacillus sp.]